MTNYDHLRYLGFTHQEATEIIANSTSNVISVELPKVKGSDDAAKAMWVPIAELNGENTYEDHKEIILEMVKYVV